MLFHDLRDSSRISMSTSHDLRRKCYYGIIVLPMPDWDGYKTSCMSKRETMVIRVRLLSYLQSTLLQNDVTWKALNALHVSSLSSIVVRLEVVSGRISLPEKWQYDVML